ncbi:hypothetical protein M3Y98_00532200 [Aphelenchoides besseyi]|nr:hypothetical protein M3Y98_00532200 [Aphelenchoides besseyi]KAI6208055.1 hypothetical protein M3Y96_00074100 [Aphelenchoides besseyi]
MSLIKSVLAGVCASTGATALKFASTGDFEFKLTVFLYVTFVLASVLVWWLQLKSISDSVDTTTPVLCFTGANFVSAGIYGWVFHGERHGTTWTIGLLLVVIGVCVVQLSSKKGYERMKDE